MHLSTLRFIVRRGKSSAIPPRRYLFHIFMLCFLVAVIWVEFGMVHAISFDHTNPSVDVSCQKLNFSQDGNPFPLCPGPNPGGGNCVWWAWEQWHLLGYNLPLNWGNAADWIVDAERFGLPLGTKPRLGSIAVFPVADGLPSTLPIKTMGTLLLCSLGRITLSQLSMSLAIRTGNCASSISQARLTPAASCAYAE